jgi:hypothetical protein
MAAATECGERELPLIVGSADSEILGSRLALEPAASSDPALQRGLGWLLRRRFERFVEELAVLDRSALAGAADLEEVSDGGRPVDQFVDLRELSQRELPQPLMRRVAPSPHEVTDLLERESDALRGVDDRELSEHVLWVAALPGSALGFREDAA